MTNASLRTSVVAIVSAAFVLLSSADRTVAVEEPTLPTPERAEADLCESRRSIFYEFAAGKRQLDLTFTQKNLDIAISGARGSAELDDHGRRRSERMGLFLLGFHALVGAAACLRFWRQRGVSRLERALCLVALLAVMAEGVREFVASRRVNAAATAETERVIIEAARRVADEARLVARWEYERRMAAADLAFERCLAPPEAAP